MGRVSSIESVVWVMYATRSGSATETASASATEETRAILAGASPIVPSTSSCPGWPIRTIEYPRRANRTASRWTLVTSGHVASMTVNPRRAASSRTRGAMPCAEKITVAPSGTESSSSTNRTPRSSNPRTTWRLCTISLRT